MRFNVLDAWRGIAAVLVALFHLQAAGHAYDLAFLRNSYLFVDFFFVLSGFVISHAYFEKIGNQQEFAEFIVRRFGRVWPLHVTVLGAFVLVEALKLLLATSGEQAGLAPFDASGHTAPAALPYHLVLAQALGVLDKLSWNEPSWSISAEFWMYVLFGLTCVLLTRRKPLALAALGLAGAATVAAYSNSGMDVTFDLGFPRCVFGFTVGALVYRTHTWQAGRSRHRLISGWLSELLAVAMVVLFVSIAGRTAVSIAAPLAFAIPVFVFGFESGPLSRALVTRPFQALGRWSYSIYMVHGLIAFVLGLVTSWLQRRLGVSLWQEVDTNGVMSRVITGDKFLLDLLFVMYLVSVVALAALTYRWIEQPRRAYFNRLARRIGKRTPQPESGRVAT